MHHWLCLRKLLKIIPDGEHHKQLFGEFGHERIESRDGNAGIEVNLQLGAAHD